MWLHFLNSKSSPVCGCPVDFMLYRGNTNEKLYISQFCSVTHHTVNVTYICISTRMRLRLENKNKLNEMILQHFNIMCHNAELFPYNQPAIIIAFWRPICVMNVFLKLFALFKLYLKFQTRFISQLCFSNLPTLVDIYKTVFKDIFVTCIVKEYKLIEKKLLNYKIYFQ